MERKFNLQIYLVLLVLNGELQQIILRNKKLRRFLRENVVVSMILVREILFNENLYTILTNVNLKNKDSQIFITGNCADVILEYISDPNGKYETENVTCVSKDQIKFEITDSTKFHIYAFGPNILNNEEGRKYFLEQLIQNKKAIFQVEVEKKKEVVLMISRMEYLEKTK